jgi:putative ABC transport system substrate-binding protein
MMQAARSCGPLRRRLLTACALAPFIVRAAVDSKTRRLAFLSTGTEALAKEQYLAILGALGARGHVEGRNLEVLMSFHARVDGLDGRTRDVVAWKPDVIVTQGTVATERLLRLTRTIPIVTSSIDPVGSGFAATMARPGGNVTGMSQGGPEMATKTMEVLRILMPRLTRIAIVAYDDAPGRMLSSFPEKAATAAGLATIRTPILVEDDIPRLFRGIAARGCQAVYWAFAPRNDEEAAVREALRARIAFVCASEYLVERGALVALGSDDSNFVERSAELVAKILAGAKPGDIPFEYPQRFRFALNAATAAKLGLKVAPDLRLRADRVIE